MGVWDKGAVAWVHVEDRYSTHCTAPAFSFGSSSTWDSVNATCRQPMVCNNRGWGKPSTTPQQCGAHLRISPSPRCGLSLGSRGYPPPGCGRHAGLQAAFLQGRLPVQLPPRLVDGRDHGAGLRRAAKGRVGCSVLGCRLEPHGPMTGKGGGGCAGQGYWNGRQKCCCRFASWGF